MNLFETASEAKYRLQTHLDSSRVWSRSIVRSLTETEFCSVSLVRAISSVTLIISIQKVAGPRFSRLKH